ncbi:unnamed protein product [Lampetra planeri]
MRPECRLQAVEFEVVAELGASTRLAFVVNGDHGCEVAAALWYKGSQENWVGKLDGSSWTTRAFTATRTA